jgi:hypothetical protein
MSTDEIEDAIKKIREGVNHNSKETARLLKGLAERVSALEIRLKLSGIVERQDSFTDAFLDELRKRKT